MENKVVGGVSYVSAETLELDEDFKPDGDRKKRPQTDIKDLLLLDARHTMSVMRKVRVMVSKQIQWLEKTIASQKDPEKQLALLLQLTKIMESFSKMNTGYIQAANSPKSVVNEGNAEDYL